MTARPRPPGFTTTDTDHEAGGDRCFDLSPGEHTLTVAFREDGTKLDRLLVTRSEACPVLFGESTDRPDSA